MVRITKDTKFCIVRNLSSGHTAPATYYGDIDKFDMVVVQSLDGKLHVMTMTDVIVDEDAYDNIIAFGEVDLEVIGKVDTSAYHDAMYREDHREDLLEQMEDLAKTLEKDLFFKFLAENDEEFNRLYEEYRQYI